MGGAPQGLSRLQGTVLGTGTLQNKGLKREKLKKFLEFSARDRVPDVLSTAEQLDCAPSQGKKQQRLQQSMSADVWHMRGPRMGWA